MKEEETERISDELVLMARNQIDNIYDRMFLFYRFPEMFKGMVDDLKIEK